MTSASSVEAQLSAARERGHGWMEELRDGDRIFFSSASGEPGELIDQFVLASNSGRIPHVTVFQMLRGGSLRLREAASQRVHLVGLTAGELTRASGQGNVTFLPLTIFQLAQAIASRQLAFDVAVIQTSRPDERGNLSLGVSVDFAADACRGSRLVVAEVNHRAPRTLGNASVHISEVDAIIEVSRDLPEVAPSPADDVARQVARNIVDFIPDGATIEVGVGTIMTAVLEGLKDRRDIGLHTGLMIDPMVPAIESGLISNARKTLDRGLSVANQARGTEVLYRFLNDNPQVSMQPASYTHNPAVLAQQASFRAINAAIEVDLLGQANCEFVDGERRSSSGGLLDFVRAATFADGARSIVVLKSTGKRGAISRIVRRLPGDGGVTLTADLADLVVTEHGVANLRGLDAERRRQAMVAIADPKFREELSGS